MTRMLFTILLSGALVLFFPFVSPVPYSNQGSAYTNDLTDGTERAVFALYMPTYPLSLDNKPLGEEYYTTQWLKPTGEGGKHAAYGALHRDRPCYSVPSDKADWRMQNMRREISWAKQAGIDGFVLDMLGMPDSRDERLWPNSLLLMAAAAEQEDFSIIIMPDIAALRDESAEDVASSVASLARFSSAYRLKDGRVLIMPFAPELVAPAWWSSFKSVLDDRHGEDIALVPLFVGTHPESWRKYAQLSYAFASWGVRNPVGNDLSKRDAESVVGLAEFAGATGVGWVQTVGVQDERPRAGLYEESVNTENLRIQWRAARELSVELVVIISWNDYSEGHHILPSAMHGRAFLDLMSYYVEWYKRGSQPEPAKGAEIYLTHRRQPFDAKPLHPQKTLMVRRGETAAVNRIEVVASIGQDGTIWINNGGATTSCEASRGLNICSAPLRLGTVSAWVTDVEGKRLATVRSPFEVQERLYLQDLQYVAASSAESFDPSTGFHCPP